ncbi:MAG: molybdate transport system permease protein [Actinomycetota bacterium]|jgi:molybdate transport system permease protein|nr:molybdate transport system permease protein [Actinomycetota bacterium]
MVSRPTTKVRARRSASPVPVLVFVGAALAALFFVVPLAGLVWRAPWSSTWRVLSSSDARTAFRLSLETSLAATAIAVVLGVPLAWVQARVSYPGRNIVRAVTLLPMVLPPVVGGVALLLALGRNGLVGQYLDRVGVHLPFHVAGAVVAETFVSMPFLVLTVEAAFRSADQRFEDAARTLGASRFSLFRRVTLPMIRPSLVAGAVLCWARALGEFGATITFAGNSQGKTQTLPLFVYVTLEGANSDAAIVLSLALVIVSLVVLVSVYRWLSTR